MSVIHGQDDSQSAANCSMDMPIANVLKIHQCAVSFISIMLSSGCQKENECTD